MIFNYLLYNYIKRKAIKHLQKSLIYRLSDCKDHLILDIQKFSQMKIIAGNYIFFIFKYLINNNFDCIILLLSID